MAEGAHDHVVPHRHAAERPELLERPADAPAIDLVRPQPAQDLARQADLAALGAVKARDDVEQGRLPGAVRPDHADDLTRGHVEGDREIRDQAAETLGDGADLQQRERPNHSPAGPPHLRVDAPIHAAAVRAVIRCPGAR